MMSKNTPQPNITHITWTKIIMGTILFYGSHVLSTHIYASGVCVGGIYGPAFIATPHCKFLFEIMNWSRSWYITIVWMVAAKLVQDLSWGLDFLIFKTEQAFTKKHEFSASIYSEIHNESNFLNRGYESQKKKQRRPPLPRNAMIQIKQTDIYCPILGRVL